MPSADQYRARSIECLIEADRATDPQMGEQLVRLAMAYAKLAQILERNARTDLVYETPPPKPPLNESPRRSGRPLGKK